VKLLPTTATPIAAPRCIGSDDLLRQPRPETCAGVRRRWAGSRRVWSSRIDFRGREDRSKRTQRARLQSRRAIPNRRFGVISRSAQREHAEPDDHRGNADDHADAGVLASGHVHSPTHVPTACHRSPASEPVITSVGPGVEPEQQRPDGSCARDVRERHECCGEVVEDVGRQQSGCRSCAVPRRRHSRTDAGTRSRHPRRRPRDRARGRSCRPARVATGTTV